MHTLNDPYFGSETSLKKEVKIKFQKYNSEKKISKSRFFLNSENIHRSSKSQSRANNLVQRQKNRCTEKSDSFVLRNIVARDYMSIYVLVVDIQISGRMDILTNQFIKFSKGKPEYSSSGNENKTS